jgi:hypothetical protein
LDGLAPNRPRRAAREPREDFMTVPISQRGKEYLETAQTLLRAAQTMTDSAIAGQLKERRAEKAAHADAAKALARSAARA